MVLDETLWGDLQWSADTVFGNDVDAAILEQTPG